MSSPALSNRSGKEVDDFTGFCEGDVEPSTNKRIQTLIYSAPEYIVFIDDDGYTEWAFNSDTSDGFETIANGIGELESLSTTQLSRRQREPFARLLGEAMARILGDQNRKQAEEVLAKASAYLSARGAENARNWYLQGAGQVSLIALAVALLLLWYRGHDIHQPWLDFTEITIGSLIGALGAFFSIASRTEAITLDPVAGSKIHRIEGTLRVAVGIIGALIVALAIKADLVFGIFRSLQHPFTAMVIVCLAAGSSERLASGLIKKVEKSVNGVPNH